MKVIVLLWFLVSMSVCFLAPSPVWAEDGRRPPNFIIILTDDQGYADLGCFGSEDIQTPHIDQLAREGCRLTSFYVASPVCTPSRAALLTGCYPVRVSMEKGVVFPQDDWGLHPDELTIAELLKPLGYATACVGKWHLGHREAFLPTSQGFDSYYGIPYSNDMNHPANEGKVKQSQDAFWLNPESALQAWNTPLMRDSEIIELPVDQRTITRRYTDEAIDFIEANVESPFFLYLAHSMPHIPLYIPEDAYLPDPKHAYKAVIEHIDAEVGRLVDVLEDQGLSQHTYVIFTSDNGPWLKFGSHAGSAKPLRAGKGTTFEGGQRVPFVAWAPGRIPAGSSQDTIVSSIDLLPTLVSLAGTSLEQHPLAIDGVDVSSVLTEGRDSARDEFLYYGRSGHLEGIRQGEWKLLKVKRQYCLYDLGTDIVESMNLAQQYPERVEELKQRMVSLGDAIARAKRPRGELLQ